VTVPNDQSTTALQPATPAAAGRSQLQVEHLQKRYGSRGVVRDVSLGVEAGEVVDAVIAQSQTQAKTLWKLREAPAELNTQMHPPVNFDVSLPQAEIGRFAAAIQAAFDARWPGHHTLFFGHVGDGNLHVSTDGATVGGACEAVEAELYRVVGAFHGSVSAEHGIGLHKKPFLALSRTPQELAAMRAIKAALDPLGLMNPGKVF
jgi:FAD/FMN-containing dehydrogenase